MAFTRLKNNTRSIASCLCLIVAFMVACNDMPAPAAVTPVGQHVIDHADRGRTLFAIHCAACHTMLKDATGPALSGITARWQGDTAALKAYIRDPAATLRHSLPRSHISRLHSRFGRVAMPGFGFLTSADIDSLIRYMSGNIY